MRKRKLMALLLTLLILFGSIQAAAVESAGAPAIQVMSAANPAGSWFYGQLTAQGKKIYDELLRAFRAGELDDGKTSIELIGAGVTDETAVRAYLNGSLTLFDDFAAAKDAFDLEHPEAWFIDSSDLSFRVTTNNDGKLYASIGVGREDNYYVDGVTGKEDVAAKASALENAIGGIAAGAKSCGTDFEKVKYVHDQITHGISYRFEQDCTGDNAGFIRTSYALVTHEGVCEGYVRSFQMAMNELGIPCVPVHGLQTSGTPEQHMWCAVMLGGEWYAVDPTWDDPVGLDKDGNIRTTGKNGDDGGETETYLLVGQDVIGANWRPSGYVSTGGFAFAYPEIAMTSYGSGVLERNGLKVEYARDKMEGLPSTVYHVSYNGDGLVEAAKKGYYFLVKMYDVNADGSVNEFDDWYYSVHGLHAVQSSFDPNNTFRSDANPYFGDTDEYLTYNILNCEYVEFAITTKAPPAWKSAQELWDIGGYFDGDAADILAETGLIYNENGGYEQPPYVKNVSPGFNTPVYAGKDYSIHIEFTDILYHPDRNSVDNAVGGKVNDANTAMGQTVAVDYRGTTYSWGVNGRLPHTFADRREPTDIRWTCETHKTTHSGMNTITSECRLSALDYHFNASKMWADDSIQYEFYLTGLVGVQSNKFPNSWSYVFHNNYPFATCPLCSPFKWNLWGQPQALNNPDDLDLAELTVRGVDGKEESLARLTERMNLDPYDMNGRLMLVVENLDSSRSSTEELANAIEKSEKVDIPDGAVLGSSLFEIDFARICGKTIVETGQSVRVCLGFPQGIDASMAGIVFKAYHFTRNDAGAIISVEEIPISVTPYGLVVECMRFSPFEIVALDAARVPGLEEDTSRSLILSVDGHGSVSSDVPGAGSVISFGKNEKHTFTIKADKGYAVDVVSFSGKTEAGLKGDTLTLSYDDIAETGAILSVSFAAASVKEAEKEAGLTAAAPTPCAHEHIERTESKAPTCEKKGYTSLLRCKDCDTVLSASEEIPARGHTDSAVREGYVPAECGKPGFTGKAVCSVCGITLIQGETIPALEHKFENGLCIYCKTEEKPEEKKDSDDGSASFTDVPAGAYYAGAVAWAVENGVTKGTGDGTTFSPNDPCTRAQFVTFLWRAAGSPEPASTANPFKDVSETAHADYYKAILWTVGQGITNGTGDGTTFSPGAVVTRAQSVTFMHRYAQKAGIAARTGVASFDDVANEGALAAYYDAIGWAVANGITNGNSTTENTFGPMDDCNRAMMITFLHRLFTNVTA